MAETNSFHGSGLGQCSSQLRPCGLMLNVHTRNLRQHASATYPLIYALNGSSEVIVIAKKMYQARREIILVQETLMMDMGAQIVVFYKGMIQLPAFSPRFRSSYRTLLDYDNQR